MAAASVSHRPTPSLPLSESQGRAKRVAHASSCSPSRHVMSLSSISSRHNLLESDYEGLRRPSSRILSSSQGPSSTLAFFHAAANSISIPKSGISGRAVVTAVFERFTERAIKSVMFAQKEAKAMLRSEVGTEQLLMGLVAMEDRTSTGFLGTGLRSDVTREAVHALVREGSLLPPLSLQPRAASEIPFSKGSKRVFETALDESRKMGHNYIAPEHLVLSLLVVDVAGANRVIARLGVSRDQLRSEAIMRLRGELESDGRPSSSSSPSAMAQQQGAGGKGDRSAAVAGEQRKPGGSKGKSVLEEFCTDLTARAALGKIDPVIGRATEIERVVQILARRTKNNPMLLGDPGVGKTAIAEGLALRIVENDVPVFLQEKRVVSLDLALLLAGAKERGELESRVTSLVKEVVDSKGNIILLIDEVHTLVGSGSVGRGGAAGAGLDIANLLKPALARGLMQCIGATTLDEHRKHIEKDKALARRFQPVMVEEPSEADAIAILTGLKPKYEAHHGCYVTSEAIAAAVHLSARYLPDRQLPDKAIDLMDEAGSCARIAAFQRGKAARSKVLEGNPEEYWREIRAVQSAQQGSLVRQSVYGGGASAFLSYPSDSPSFFPPASYPSSSDPSAASSILGTSHDDEYDSGPVVVGPAEIAAVASMWSGIPLNQITSEEAHTLLNLEASLRTRVVGQDDAAIAVSRALRRARAGLKAEGRPVAAMLFAGPTGVGKTELTKALAEIYYGRPSALIRLDMSEFMERHSVSKLVGAPPGYIGFGEGGKLTEAVRRNPFSVVLLDEIEKAHPDVVNLLLQVFEDGRLTDSQGRTVSFRNTLLILTSNIGSTAIARGGSHRIGFDLKSAGSANPGQARYEALKDMLMEELRGFFRPELLNRLDEVVVFRSLEKEQVRTIVDMMLKETSSRLLDLHGVTLQVTERALEKVCDLGYDRSYGARPLRRAVMRYIEDPVSEAILTEDFEEGDIVVVDTEESGLGQGRAALDDGAGMVVTRRGMPDAHNYGLCLPVLKVVNN